MNSMSWLKKEFSLKCILDCIIESIPYQREKRNPFVRELFQLSPDYCIFFSETIQKRISRSHLHDKNNGVRWQIGGSESTWLLPINQECSRQVEVCQSSKKKQTSGWGRRIWKVGVKKVLSFKTKVRRFQWSCIIAPHISFFTKVHITFKSHMLRIVLMENLTKNLQHKEEKEKHLLRNFLYEFLVHLFNNNPQSASTIQMNHSSNFNIGHVDVYGKVTDCIFLFSFAVTSVIIECELFFRDCDTLTNIEIHPERRDEAWIGCFVRCGSSFPVTKTVLLWESSLAEVPGTSNLAPPDVWRKSKCQVTAITSESPQIPSSSKQGFFPQNIIANGGYSKNKTTENVQLKNNK
ncbi:hypothetical protein VP01_294g2 [Puccinia sorghi]|uniref:Uncharacterized protein n=1 Tax=Puccinia sorghi TaxID=27349 RepID=A0A0L6V2R0_9BASI|nr:hypothetical protein VP01_294g2 [Puccinia sorghi]